MRAGAQQDRRGPHARHGRLHPDPHEMGASRRRHRRPLPQEQSDIPHPEPRHTESRQRISGVRRHGGRGLRGTQEARARRLQRRPPHGPHLREGTDRRPGGHRRRLLHSRTRRGLHRAQHRRLHHGCDRRSGRGLHGGDLQPPAARNRVRQRPEVHRRQRLPLHRPCESDGGRDAVIVLEGQR